MSQENNKSKTSYEIASALKDSEHKYHLNNDCTQEYFPLSWMDVKWCFLLYNQKDDHLNKILSNSEEISHHHYHGDLVDLFA